MKAQFLFHPHVLSVLPLLGVASGQCDCGEDHGWEIVVGWLLWTVQINFGGHE